MFCSLRNSVKPWTISARRNGKATPLFRWSVIDVGGGGVVQWSECSNSAVTAGGRQAAVDAGTGFAAHELSGRRGSNGKLTTAFRSTRKCAQGGGSSQAQENYQQASQEHAHCTWQAGRQNGETQTLTQGNY
jgi:hypothetical protein